MIRRPPRSTRTDTLFPDTTLFRSGLERQQPAVRAEQLVLVDLAGGEAGDEQLPDAAAVTQAHRMPAAVPVVERPDHARPRSEEHTSELQSLMRISYAVFCLKKKKYINTNKNDKEAYTTQ